MRKEDSTGEFCVENWGLLAYNEAATRQQIYVDERLSGRRANTLIFVEHPPVYTLGSKAGASGHLLWDQSKCAAEGIEVVQTNRGGDVTYHGPGQQIAYFIWDWSEQRDLHLWLRTLENIILNTLKQLDLYGQCREGLTGVWIGERKIAAIGVATRRWITSHGFSLNVNPCLEHFSGIVPCGITPERGTVTSIQKEKCQDMSMPPIRDSILQAVTQVLGSPSN